MRGDLGRIAILASLVGGLLLGAGRAAAAQCTSYDPWPSFTAAVRTASTVFVGTVIETPGEVTNPRFVLRVDEVFRGSAPEIIGYSAFTSGVRLRLCPGGSSLVVREVGERLAFAYGARLRNVRGRVDAVAFVGGSQPDLTRMPRMERLPMWRIRALVGRSRPKRSPSMAPLRLHAELPPAPEPTEELLARLVIEEVEPGVSKVMNDGVRELGEPCGAAGDALDCPQPALIVAGLDGSVWLLGGVEPRFDRLLRLGEEAVHEVSLSRLDDVEVGPGGTLWAISAGRLHSFDGEAWTVRRERPRRGRVTAVEVDPDGIVWANWVSGRDSRIGRLDARGWSSVGFPSMVGSQTADPGSFALGPHGVWMAYEGGRGAAGLLYFGAGRWRIVAPVTPPVRAVGFDVGLDGTLWAYFPLADGSRALYRLGGYPMALPADEETFTTDVPLPHGLDPRFLRAGPDGSLWFTPRKAEPLDSDPTCDGLARFDGVTWTHYLRDACVRSFDIGPDGTAFALASEPCPRGCAFIAVDVYFISPEPVRSSE